MITILDPEWCEFDGGVYCGTNPKNRRCDTCEHKPKRGGKSDGRIQ